MNLYAGYFAMFGQIDPMGLVTFVHGPSVPPDPTGINEHNIVSIGGGAAPVYGSGSGYGSQDSLNGLAAFEFVEKNIPAPAEIAIMGWGDYDEQLAGLRQARNSGRFSKACKCIKQGAKNFFNKLFNSRLPSGSNPPLRAGAKPNSSYTQLKDGKAFQTAHYDKNGKVIAHVDWKTHGKGAQSGHGHVFTVPGNVQSGPFAHGKGNIHIPNSNLPVKWQKPPKGLKPYTPVGGK